MAALNAEAKLNAPTDSNSTAPEDAWTSTNAVKELLHARQMQLVRI